MHDINDNKIYQQLVSLGICSEDSVEELWPKVRDRDDVRVLRDTKSAVIFLSNTNHIDNKYYSDKTDLSYWNSSNRAEVFRQTFDDDQRRAIEFKSLILGKNWLDIGTGAGGILDLLIESAN